jgi:predicted permease
MKVLRRWWHQILGSMGRRRPDHELSEEFESHVAMLAADNERHGMCPAEARRAAVLTFGAVESAKENLRDQRGLPAVEALHQDVRYALRGVRRQPFFTAAAITCLALGIGANTAIFSLLNVVRFRDLPVRNADTLVFFRYAGATPGLQEVRDTSSGYGSSSLPYAAYEALRDHARTLRGVFAFASTGMQGNGVILNASGHLVTTDAELVSATYFSVLGVSPSVGRAFVASDYAPGSPGVALISHGLWQREFGGQTAAIGSHILMDGAHYTIVGVVPASFRGLMGAPGVWIPLVEPSTIAPWGSRAPGGTSRFSNRRYWWCAVGGRLRPGVPREQVEAETTALFHQAITVGLTRPVAGLPRLVWAEASPAMDGLRGRLTTTLVVLAVTAALVLLTACANLSILLLARARARQREIAIRLAIGASRARVVRQLLTESVLLSLIGGTVGLVLAAWGGPALLRLLVSARQPAPVDAGLDMAAFWYATLVSVATGVVFGLLPAFRATRVELAPQLAGTTTAVTTRQRAGFVLVAAQVALSVVLLFAAGLFMRSFGKLDSQSLGFRRENLLLFDIDPERCGYKDARGLEMHRRLLDRLRDVPGVRAATFAEYALMSGWSNSSPAATDGRPLPAGSDDTTHFNRVGADYFATLGIGILAGRGIEERDASGDRPVAVVNESWAKWFFPNENPVGRRVSTGRNTFRPDRAYEIVGVVEDAKFRHMRDAAPRTIYPSYGASWDRSRRMCYTLRTAGDPRAVVAAVREAVRTIDPNLPVFDIRTQSEQIRDDVGRELMLAQVSGFFGAFALLLVAVGLYATMSYSVAQRTSEIGIRMALGARRSAVIWMVVRGSLGMVLAGTAIGLPAAMALARLVGSTLYGVTPIDGTTMLWTTLALCGVGAVASLVPAGRAARIDPMRALRLE